MSLSAVIVLPLCEVGKPCHCRSAVLLFAVALRPQQRVLTACFSSFQTLLGSHGGDCGLFGEATFGRSSFTTSARRLFTAHGAHKSRLLSNGPWGTGFHEAWCTDFLSCAWKAPLELPYFLANCAEVCLSGGDLQQKSAGRNIVIIIGHTSRMLH